MNDQLFGPFIKHSFTWYSPNLQNWSLTIRFNLVSYPTHPIFERSPRTLQGTQSSYSKTHDQGSQGVGFNYPSLKQHKTLKNLNSKEFKTIYIVR